VPPAGFERAIRESERLQTYALDRSTTGIGKNRVLKKIKGARGKCLVRRVMVIFFTK
jgi:hypothetical protein